MNKRIIINESYGGFTLSKKAMAWLDAHGYGASESESESLLGVNLCLDFGSIDESRRGSPILLAMFDELGSVAASGENSSLEAVELGESGKYVIMEYDGMETVYTPENIKWVTCD
jgi:hypothetical protein